MKKIIITLTMFLCVVGFNGCDSPVALVSTENDIFYQNKIIGRWVLVGKTIMEYDCATCSKDYLWDWKYIILDNEIFFIEFTGIKTNNFISNMQPYNAYYNVNMDILILYYSIPVPDFNDDKDRKKHIRFSIDYEYLEKTDTLTLAGLNKGWLGGLDTSEYCKFHFIKMEDE